MTATRAAAGLLRAICAAPADDAPRLVYADWLDEHGEGERAEFIRVQVELAKCPPEIRYDRRWNDPRYSMGKPWDGLRIREDGEDWIACQWYRGFVSSIALDCAAFLRHAAAIFAVQPVTSVRLTDKNPLPLDGRRNAFRWSNRDDNAADFWELPAELLRALPTGPTCILVRDADENWRSMFSVRDYDSADASHAALSAACVAFGRKAADLPAL